jgi:hypothetical protein
MKTLEKIWNEVKTSKEIKAVARNMENTEEDKK